MRKKVTIKDLARMAEVTPATVSMVLNGKAKISAATRTKILQLAELHHYVPNLSARGLVKARTNAFGIIMPDLVEPFNAAVLRAISNSVIPTGYHLVLYDVFASSDWEDALYHRIGQEGRVDGIIHKALEMSETDIKRLEALQVPMVVWENELSWVDCVAVDNEAGAFNATQHLLGQGRRKIGVVGCELASQIIAARLFGVQRALRDAGQMFEPQHYFQTKSFSAQEGTRAADYFHSLTNKPEAIFVIAGDYVALGFLARTRKLAFDIPGDMAVIGFDDLELASYACPELTTVRQPVQKMADGAVKLLMQRLENPSKAYEVLRFKTELIIRESA